MGNDASTGRSSKGPRSGKLLVAGWQKRKLPTQLFGVVRHAERADGVFAFWEGGRWSSSEDGRRFPLDPPLSDSGLEQAKSLGAWIDDYAQKKDSKFHVVVCSPYSRCVQTAVGICNRLGPNVKMLIDLSLGEVYGPSVMGEAEPRSHLRAFSVAAKYCRANQINVVRRVVGEAPAWPETLQDARRRFALRFLQYLQRGVTAKRNFLIVTHGDCIGSVMGIMPDQQDVMVEKVDYGAMILGSSQAQHDLRPPAPSSKAMASVLPLSPQEEEMVSGRDEFSHFQDRLQSVEEALEEMESLQELQADKWAMPVDSTTRSDEQSHVAKLTQKAMTGWQCETMNITTRSKKSSKSTKLVKRLNALVESGPFSMQKIEKLLGAIPQTPLGDSTPYSSTPLAANYSGTLTIQSGLSASTYLFGQSEVDSEDFGSGLCSPSEGDGRRVLSSNLDIKTRDRPHPNYRSASAAEKLSMKHYTSPLEGVLELEERENSLRGQQVEPPQKWWPLDAEGSPSSGGSRGSTGSKKKAESRVSLMSSNSLLNMVNEAEEESDIINKPKEESNGKSTVLKCGIGGAGLTLRESPSDANASPAGDRFSTASCKTAEPLEKPKLAAPVGASSLLARRRASLNLKPLGE